MHAFPHHYAISAAAAPDGDVVLAGPGLQRLVSLPPVEFDGPGDRWSPEALIVAAVADCFVLTFRGIAKVSRLPWLAMTCETTGTLDRVEHVTRFTEFVLRVSLDIPDGVDEELVRRLLLRAEQTCLIANSVNARCHVDVHIRVVQHADA
jgi:organic hydroperoxide reductase OsmC/OhrA